MIPLDPEVKALCEAINGCMGLRTYASCCGHGKTAFRIWLHVNENCGIRALYPLLRVIDPRYGGPYHEKGDDGIAAMHQTCWTVQAQDTDLPERPVTFLLESPTVGQSAYDDAALLAKNLTELLVTVRTHEGLQEMFGLRKVPRKEIKKRRKAAPVKVS